MKRRIFWFVSLTLVTAFGCSGVYRIGDLPQHPGVYTAGEVALARPSTSAMLVRTEEGKIVPLVAGQQPGWLVDVGKSAIGTVRLFWKMSDDEGANVVINSRGGGGGQVVIQGGRAAGADSPFR